ncbi:MAG: hypothetical protein WDZ51_04520 [Pirellulaceae bacterium]
MQLSCPHCSTVLEVASPAGTQVQCPTCQGIFVVPGPAAPTPAPMMAPVINTGGSSTRGPQIKKKPAKTAPPESPAAAGEEAAEEAAEGEGEGEGEGREIPWKLIEKLAYVVTISIISAGVIGAVIVAISSSWGPEEEVVYEGPYVADGQANTGNQIQEVMEAAERGEIHVKWIDAKKSSATMQGFKVKVNHADWGEVRGRDENNNLITSEGRPYIVVYLELANRSNKTFPFKSWYGNEFTTENGALRTAQLSDDHKNVYYPLRFDDLKQLKWHTPSKSFSPAEEGTDSIVFDVPENFDPAQLDGLYLDLPGEAVGHSGSYRFRIPKSMIQGI